MLLKDLLVDIRNEIDGVSNADVILAINSFIIMHRMSREVIFQQAEVKEHDAGVITPVVSEVDYSVSRFDYDSPFVRFVVNLFPHPPTPSQEVGTIRGKPCNYREGEFRFLLPSEVVYVKSLYVNGRECSINSRNSRRPLNVQISDSRMVTFDFAVKFEDEMIGECLIQFPVMPVNISDSSKLPYPEHYYPALRAWVLKELYQKRRYRDPEQMAYYKHEYNRFKISTLTPVSSAREGMIGL